jgi:flavin-binding protein dodecin
MRGIIAENPQLSGSRLSGGGSTPICQRREKRRTIHRHPGSATLPSAIFLQESSMSNHVYKHIELTGSSTKDIEDAVSSAIAKASVSVRNIHWFEVMETRGQVENGKVTHWQVTIKVGFTLED